MADPRPLFHPELGIPYDEFQLANWIAFQGEHYGHSLGVNETAANVARRASQKLRRHPSHHGGK